MKKVFKWLYSCLGAGEHDAVLFTGSGCTGAVQTLVSALAIRDEEVLSINIMATQIILILKGDCIGGTS